jgi:signal peptidase II
VAVGLYFWFTPSRDRVLLVALALVVGGAIGNLIDRVSSGAVTDFLDVYLGVHHWPSFNIADSAISIGILLMAIDSFRPRHHAGEAPAAAPVSE